MRFEVRLRRIYDPIEDDDGVRVLVDRLWPRGVSKANAHLDEWFKDVAPSAALRKWFGHDAARFVDFQRRYHTELAVAPARDAWSRLWQLSRREPVTLLTATADLRYSHAQVLADRLTRPDVDDGRTDCDAGGDPACWMARVCPACGAMADTDPPARCPRCGADIAAD